MIFAQRFHGVLNCESVVAVTVRVASLRAVLPSVRTKPRSDGLILAAQHYASSSCCNRYYTTVHRERIRRTSTFIYTNWRRLYLATVTVQHPQQHGDSAFVNWRFAQNTKKPTSYVAENIYGMCPVIDTQSAVCIDVGVTRVAHRCVCVCGIPMNANVITSREKLQCTQTHTRHTTRRHKSSVSSFLAKGKDIYHREREACRYMNIYITCGIDEPMHRATQSETHIASTYPMLCPERTNTPARKHNTTARKLFDFNEQILTDVDSVATVAVLERVRSCGVQAPLRFDSIHSHMHTHTRTYTSRTDPPIHEAGIWVTATATTAEAASKICCVA